MITLDHIGWQAPGFTLRDICVQIPTGSYAVLMGPTGCGKTTLLEILCGLRQPLQGRVLISGQDVTRLEPHQRRIGYVPQDLALFPERRVRHQIGFAPKLQKHPSPETIVAELAHELHLSHLLDRLPENLSGGEKQRVALARALAAQPQVLLLDEPLSALDETSRENATQLLKDLHAKHRLTILHVTHSRAEAAALGQLHLRLEAGQLLPA